MYHTMGQRQGLGIGGLANHEHAPWYVVEKDLARNVLLVAQGKDHPACLNQRSLPTIYSGFQGKNPFYLCKFVQKFDIAKPISCVLSSVTLKATALCLTNRSAQLRRGNLLFFIKTNCA